MPASRLSASPALSVLVPVYNAAAFVGDALESVVRNVGDDVEIIVLDDGSSDGTGQVVAQFGDRVRYIAQPNAGLAATRNRLHAESRGEFVAWFDHDDINEPERFALQLEVLRRYPDVGLVSSDFSAFDAQGPIATSYAARYYGRLVQGGAAALFARTETFASESLPGVSCPLHRGSVYPAIAMGNFVHPPTIMMRRELWQKAGPLTNGIPSAADWEFLVRASRHANFAYLERSLLRYRRSTTQLSDESNNAAHMPGEMRAFEMILAADPALRASRDSIRSLYRHWNLTLAGAIAPADRLQAVQKLVGSLRYGIDVRQFSRAAVRVVAPEFVLSSLRRVKRLMKPG